jgi:hypothetical protein
MKESAGNVSGVYKYAGAHPVTAPVTGDVFNSKMCWYSKLDSTKLRQGCCTHCRVSDWLC